SAKNGVHKAFGAASPMTAFAVWQIPHPICVDLMGRIEIGDGAPKVWRVGINDLAIEGQASGLESIYAFGIGTYVDRLRISVVEVELHPGGQSVSQRQLQAVVVTVATSLPGIERRELGLIEGERSAVWTDKSTQIVRTGTGTCRITERVEIFQRQRLIAQIGIVEVVNILRSRRIGRSTRSGTNDIGCSRRLREQMFPVRNRCHGAFGSSGVGGLR